MATRMRSQLIQILASDFYGGLKREALFRFQQLYNIKSGVVFNPQKNFMSRNLLTQLLHNIKHNTENCTFNCIVARVHMLMKIHDNFVNIFFKKLKEIVKTEFSRRRQATQNFIFSFFTRLRRLLYLYRDRSDLVLLGCQFAAFMNLLFFFLCLFGW